ncbi:hypothetical protein VT92_0237840 (plasmid) [Clostridium sporogenes]|nr:hypothetical protein VT92_0237840 [Clostridium sporogenes]
MGVFGHYNIITKVLLFVIFPVYPSLFIKTMSKIFIVKLLGLKKLAALIINKLYCFYIVGGVDTPCKTGSMEDLEACPPRRDPRALVYIFRCFTQWTVAGVKNIE